jgi:hypothetical protein
MTDTDPFSFVRKGSWQHQSFESTLHMQRSCVQQLLVGVVWLWQSKSPKPRCENHFAFGLKQTA